LSADASGIVDRPAYDVRSPLAVLCQRLPTVIRTGAIQNK